MIVEWMSTNGVGPETHRSAKAPGHTVTRSSTLGRPQFESPSFTNPVFLEQLHKMTNLDMLLLKGASASSPEEGLQELRYTILTKGIPANSEGMVRSPQYPMRLHCAWAHSRAAQWF